MNKKIDKLLVPLWILAAMGIRLWYFLFGNYHVETVDTYEYFAHAMVRVEKSEPLLTSGIAYAYTERLSDLLAFVGNQLKPVIIYQLLLQSIWLVLFFFAVRFLFGKATGYISGSILALSPWILKSAYVVSTENYLMFYFTILLFSLGYFLKRTKTVGWYRSNWCELYLMITGFVLGIVCVWNYIGWLLIPVSIYVLACNYINMKDRFFDEALEAEKVEKYQLMPINSQTFIIVMGLLLGMFATLMKYTGLTGLAIGEQYLWWISQLNFPEAGRCQDISIQLLLWLMIALIAGIIWGAIAHAVKRRKEWAQMIEVGDVDDWESVDKDVVTTEDIEKTEEVIETEEIIEAEEAAEEEKKVVFLENPLPVPKKHVKKEMDFKIVDYVEESDKKSINDFDFEITENDDFDV